MTQTYYLFQSGRIVRMTAWHLYPELHYKYVGETIVAKLKVFYKHPTKTRRRYALTTMDIYLSALDAMAAKPQSREKAAAINLVREALATGKEYISLVPYTDSTEVYHVLAELGIHYTRAIHLLLPPYEKPN